MKQLNTADLAEYIKHAIDLESAVIGQNQIIQQYVDDSQKKRPTLQQITAPQKPISPPSLWDLWDDKDLRNLLGILIMAFLFGVLFLIGFLVNLGDPDVFMVNILWLIMGIVFCMPGVICYIKYKKASAADQKDYEMAYQNYKNRCEQIEKQNTSLKNTYDTQIQMWTHSNTNALVYLNNKLDESRHALDQYYSADIIFPKYRNLPALSSLYEYLTTGRCSELTGPNGAYNLYESEARQNTIITKLNIIISQLEQIRDNQYVLYEEVKKINYNTQKIAAEIAQIRGYTYVLTELTALNTYYTGIAAQSASAMAFYQALS